MADVAEAMRKNGQGGKASKLLDDAQAIVAQEGGYYKKAGLDSELIEFKSGTDLIKAIEKLSASGGTRATRSAKSTTSAGLARLNTKVSALRPKRSRIGWVTARLLSARISSSQAPSPLAALPPSARTAVAMNPRWASPS